MFEVIECFLLLYSASGAAATTERRISVRERVSTERAPNRGISIKRAATQAFRKEALLAKRHLMADEGPNKEF